MKTLQIAIIFNLLQACITSTLVQASEQTNVAQPSLQQLINLQFQQFQTIQNEEIKKKQETIRQANYAKICPQLAPYNRVKPDQAIVVEDLPSALQQEILSFICPAEPKFLQKDIKTYCKAKELSLVPALSFEYKPNTQKAKRIPLLPLQSNFYRYIERAPKKVCKEDIYNNIQQLIALDSIDLFSDLLLINSLSKRFHQGQYTAGDYLRAKELVKNLNPNISQKLKQFMNKCPKEVLTKKHTHYLYHSNNRRKSPMILNYVNLSKNNS